MIYRAQSKKIVVGSLSAQVAGRRARRTAYLFSYVLPCMCREIRLSLS